VTRGREVVVVFLCRLAKRGGGFGDGVIIVAEVVVVLTVNLEMVLTSGD
jgi:hypothetical protein